MTLSLPSLLKRLLSVLHLSFYVSLSLSSNHFQLSLLISVSSLSLFLMYEDDWSLWQCWGSVFLLLYWVKTTPAVSLADISPADSLFPQSHNRPTVPQGTWNKVGQTWSHSISSLAETEEHAILFTLVLLSVKRPIQSRRQENTIHDITFRSIPRVVHILISSSERRRGLTDWEYNHTTLLLAD